MINLKQIRTINGETVLAFQYDVCGSIQILMIEIDKRSIDAKLTQVSDTLSRDPTRQNWIDAVKSIINDARLNIQQMPQPVNTADMINQDVEAS